MVRVLMVEDDETIADIVRYYFEQSGGYELTWVPTAGEALARAHDAFDVILLDIMLPDVDGVKLCASLRKWYSCPIIFVSSVQEGDTIIRALEMGGDDYIVKPFDNKILDARIKANLRRVQMDREQQPARKLTCKGFSLDVRARELKKGRETVELLPMEYKILCYFMQHPHEYIAAGDLYSEVWGRPSYGDVRTVTVHIHNLRKKIEDDPKQPRYLKSAWGKGYYFDPKDTAEKPS